MWSSSAHRKLKENDDGDCNNDTCVDRNENAKKEDVNATDGAATAVASAAAEYDDNDFDTVCADSQRSSFFFLIIA